MKRTLTAIAAAAALCGVAAAQDSEELVINLSGEVESNCELVPEGTANFDVDMLETGNQGSLSILYSCNSPYTVSLTSTNGGMSHQESGGAVNIDYDIEASFLGLGIFSPTTTNSADMNGTPQVIVTNNDWQNILVNGGTRTGNLDLSFDSLNEYAVAGTYSDTLTITLAANY
ncbi:hypothetical protein [Hyphomonas pacifica]|uniref:Uncharacterized protein n=1 Tax=Hyphomonas pacifica TaxID=1280941 RepID=A0A062TVA2_9PROT|nr:hypothetical protein [Hyphomonas pacifica]KCZ49040.1 hypothetical protein HY2_15485 [Hyphomonas pacifica]RAN31884.1 hypothetical protein HY3_16200 [Hyphomonas pacifica]RAN34004.1 hypothetical protein HY11_15955 [Hyphomonas pacifica]